ncbi:hypothetical protein HHK36_000006 [Tetracentron sinense]|uniref:Uncharacterized protein n=1 Tax=Tetracentron sinense TaxID=13715 RepID=A0A835DQH6_TETSI|nr:hypothetical protein HHK36_000006 [Tetracentron sinense]
MGLKVRQKLVLSRDQKEYIPFMNVQRKKYCICLERIKGKIVNVLDGLELHTGVVSARGHNRIVDFIHDHQEMRRKGDVKAVLIFAGPHLFGIIHNRISGVPCLSVPRRNKPRLVDLYYSSWCIRAELSVAHEPVESKRGDGQLTACEVLLFHHEDMGIPWDIAKLGVRHGMWGAVNKIEPGLRAYQKARSSGVSISRCAFMAHINTKINADYLRCLESTSNSSDIETTDPSEKPLGRNIPKLLVVGGVVVLACSLDCGLLTKAFIFGVARRFAKIGRKL